MINLIASNIHVFAVDKKNTEFVKLKIISYNID